MPHSPTLTVFTIRFKKRKKQQLTFKEYFLKKYDLKEDEIESNIFKEFFEDFLVKLGKDNYIKDTATRKAIGVPFEKENDLNNSISSHSQSNIIEGVIEGGKFGAFRKLADLENKRNSQSIGNNKVVLDKFYFLLNLPLDKKVGYLILQSYSDESIQELFIDVLKETFKFKDPGFGIMLDPFVPERFVEDFKKEASLSMFSFITSLSLNDS